MHPTLSKNIRSTLVQLITSNLEDACELMKDYTKLWFDRLLRRNTIPIASPLTITGERNKHLGPMFQFASVNLTIESSQDFEVVDNVSANDELRRLGYPEMVIFGLLDILMVSDFFVGNVRIVLNEIRYDEIDSSPMALREAGRDAGRKIVESLRRRGSG
jgi:hypothetical protein